MVREEAASCCPAPGASRTPIPAGTEPWASHPVKACPASEAELPGRARWGSLVWGPGQWQAAQAFTGGVPRVSEDRRAGRGLVHLPDQLQMTPGPPQPPAL